MGQALKRKYSEFQQLHEIIRTADASNASEAFRRIRAGEQIQTILKRSQHNKLEEATHANDRLRKFFITLTQTTAPLSYMVHLALEVLVSPQLMESLPEARAYDPLRDSVVSIETLAGVLGTSNIDVSLLPPDRILAPAHVADGFSGSPPYWVHASPWTTIDICDHAVSHLVSTFLALVNGYWRFVEQNVFLKAIRSGESSEYCSSFLVNAILACASVRTDIHQSLRELTRCSYIRRSKTLLRHLVSYLRAARIFTEKLKDCGC